MILKEAIKAASFPERITDVFWPREELYREGQAESTKSAEGVEGSEETE